MTTFVHPQMLNLYRVYGLSNVITKKKGEVYSKAETDLVIEKLKKELFISLENELFAVNNIIVLLCKTLAHKPSIQNDIRMIDKIEKDLEYLDNAT